jgi:hypothetical protein
MNEKGKAANWYELAAKLASSDSQRWDNIGNLYKYPHRPVLTRIEKQDNLKMHAVHSEEL